MKRLFICTGLFIVATALVAQQAPPKSPPATASAKLGAGEVSIAYSSPRVNGREGKIFTKDGLIGHEKNYPVWRAGANSATKLHTDTDLTIGKLEVPKGDYTLYVDVSNPDAWTLIVNKQTGQWGLTYDKAQDLGRVPMKMSKPESMVEDLTYTIKESGAGRGKITLAWENHEASVSVHAH